MIHKLAHIGMHHAVHYLAHENPVAGTGAIAGTFIAAALGVTTLPALAIIGAGAAVGAGIKALTSGNGEDRPGELDGDA